MWARDFVTRFWWVIRISFRRKGKTFGLNDKVEMQIFSMIYDEHGADVGLDVIMAKHAFEHELTLDGKVVFLVVGKTLVEGATFLGYNSEGLRVQMGFVLLRPWFEISSLILLSSF